MDLNTLNRTLKYVEQKLPEIQEKLDKSMIIVKILRLFTSQIDKSKVIMDFKNIILT